MVQEANLNTETIVASLRHIMPPTALIDVGIGRGTGAMHQWRSWDVQAAWLVDAEATQLAWAETLAATHLRWRIHVAVLAEVDGHATYYRASNPAESGLVPPSNLVTLWPNLREKERGERVATRLDTLLSHDGSLPAGVGWWLVVDCLPALRVLQGAKDTLERCSVLWVRTMLAPLPENEAGTSLEELQVFLNPLGFRCVQITESNHPALGDVLFVRDWAQRLQPVIAELHTDKKQAQLQYRQLKDSLAMQEAGAKAMSQERDAHAKIAEARQIQLDKLEAERSEFFGRLSAAEQARDDLTRKLAVMENDCTVKSKALIAAQAETAARANERDVQRKLAAERQAKLDVLVKEKSDLSKKFDALNKAHVELEQKVAASVQQQGATADALKEAQTVLTKLTSERDALAKDQSDLIRKLNESNKTNVELAQKLAMSLQQEGRSADALKAAQTALTEQISERDAYVKLATQRQTELDTLAKEKANLSIKLDALGKTHAELSEKLAASVQQQSITVNSLKAAQTALIEHANERDAQTKLATERQAKIDMLVREKSELSSKLEGQSKLAQDRQDQLAVLSKEKAALAEKLAAADEATQELTKLLDTFQTQVHQLTKARDDQAKLAIERANQVSQLTNQRDDLSKQRQSIDSEVQSRDAKIANLNERIAEQDHRERQLVEEIVRAEAQIELIKDLLLREGGL